jgi:hypothetical protein
MKNDMKTTMHIGAILCLWMGMLVITPSQLVAQNESTRILPVNRIPFYSTSGTISNPEPDPDPEPEYTPCGNDDYVLANGAYEAIDATVGLTLSPAKHQDILASSYFRQLGHNLCIQKRTETGSDVGVSWTNAQTTCTGGWRLPNLAELAAINKQGGSIFSNVYGMRYERKYWSTTLTEYNGHWFFFLDDNIGNPGSGNYHPQYNDNQLTNVYVRCVRTGE